MENEKGIRMKTTKKCATLGVALLTTAVLVGTTTTVFAEPVVSYTPGNGSLGEETLKEYGFLYNNQTNPDATIHYNFGTKTVPEILKEASISDYENGLKNDFGYTDADLAHARGEGTTTPSTTPEEPTTQPSEPTQPVTPTQPTDKTKPSEEVKPSEETKPSTNDVTSDTQAKSEETDGLTAGGATEEVLREREKQRIVNQEMFRNGDFSRVVGVWKNQVGDEFRVDEKGTVIFPSGNTTNLMELWSGIFVPKGEGLIVKDETITDRTKDRLWYGYSHVPGTEFYKVEEKTSTTPVVLPTTPQTENQPTGSTASEKEGNSSNKPGSTNLATSSASDKTKEAFSKDTNQGQGSSQEVGEKAPDNRIGNAQSVENEKNQTTHKDTRELPNTGENTSILGMLGTLLNLIVLSGFTKKSKS